MKQCTKCGAALTDDAQFCQYCGNVMQTKKKKVIWPWILLAVLLVAAVAAAALLIPGMLANNRWQEQYDLAAEYLEDGDYEDALEAFLEAINLDPERAEAYLGAAEAYMAQGDREEAERILKKGIRKTDDGDLEDALEDLKEPDEPANIPTESPSAGPIPMEPAVEAEYALYVDGYTLSGVELNYYYYNAVNEFANTYWDYLSYFLDPTVPLDQQMYDESAGMTWADYFLETAVENAVSSILLCKDAEVAGFYLDREQKTQLDSLWENTQLYASYYGYVNAEEYLQAMYGPDATEESYREYLERSALSDAYYMACYQDMCTLEDARAALQADSSLYAEYAGVYLVDVRHILVIPTGGDYDSTTGLTSYSEEEWAAGYAEAEDIYRMWQESGGSEEAFAEFAAVYTEDYASAETGGLYRDVFPGQMVQAFDSWCFEAGRQVGDSGIVRTEYGYHILYFCGRGELTYQEQLVLEELRLETMTGWLEELRAGADVELGSTRYLELDLILQD